MAKRSLKAKRNGYIQQEYSPSELAEKFGLPTYREVRKHYAEFIVLRGDHVLDRELAMGKTRQQAVKASQDEQDRTERTLAEIYDLATEAAIRGPLSKLGLAMSLGRSSEHEGKHVWTPKLDKYSGFASWKDLAERFLERINKDGVAYWDSLSHYMDYFGFNSPRDMVLDQLQKSNLKSKDAAKVFWNTMTLYSKTKFG